MKAFVSAKPAAELYVQIANKLFGLPKEGTDIGGGQHAPHVPGGYGWDQEWFVPLKHPTQPLYAVAVDARLEAELSDPVARKRLSASELAKADADTAAKQTLGADWLLRQPP